jgi:DHA3 family macrolide efflux protein-like MFS transporter
MQRLYNPSDKETASRKLIWRRTTVFTINAEEPKREQTMRAKHLSDNMVVFLIIWLGQTVSQVGSGLTGFALGVWVYQSTGSALQFALIALFTVVPRIVLSPLAGVVVDRWDRRRAMIVGDSGAGAGTLLIAALFFSGRLEIWHIYLATALSSAFTTLQWPAYAAITPQLVAKESLGRANGMIQLGRGISEILAPLLAGMLVVVIGLRGIVLIDVVTFAFAVLTLIVIRLPQAAPVARNESAGEPFRQELVFGWRYLQRRPGLMGLLLFLAVISFVWAMLGAVLTPMMLTFATPEKLGMIISVAGVGYLSGSLLMSSWGGPRRLIIGVLGFELLSAASFVLMGLRPSVALVAVGAFVAHLAIAMGLSCNQALWQRKVAPEVQGRVFAAQQMITQAAAPVGYLVAGFLADAIFEPMLQEGGALTGSAGRVIGVGTGRGMALLLIVLGLVKFGLSLWGIFYPPLRRVDDTLPDATPPGDEEMVAVPVTAG